MVRSPIAIGRISMARQHDFRIQVCCAINRRLEVAHLEPEKHSVPGRHIGVADPTMVVLNIPVVQLKDEAPLGNKALIMCPSMVAPTAQQPLISATAGLDIAHADQRLWSHIGGNSANSA